MTATELLNESHRLAAAGELSNARTLAQQAVEQADTDEEIVQADAWLAKLNGEADEDADLTDFLDRLDDPISTPAAGAASNVLSVVEAASAAPAAVPDPTATDAASAPAPSVAGGAAEQPQRDPDLVAYLRRAHASGLPAPGRSAPSTAVVSDTDAVEASDEEEAETPRKGRRASARNNPFKPLLVFAVLAITLVYVWAPWKSSSSAQRGARSSAAAGYPELADLKAGRPEPVSAAELRAKLLAPAKTAEDQSRAGPGRSEDVLRREPDGTSTTASHVMNHRPGVAGTRATRATRASRASSGTFSPTTDDPPPARRRGSRVFALPDPEPSRPPTGIASSQSKLPSIDLPINTRLQAVLEIGIASSRHGRVLAQVTQAVVADGRVVVPVGALLVGESSSDATRIYVRVLEVLIHGRRFSVEATAITGDLPGLPAERRQATLEERQRADVAQGTLGVAKDLAIGLAGPAGEVLRRIGEGAVEETQREQEVDKTVVLMVPAKTRFIAVITE